MLSSPWSSLSLVLVIWASQGVAATAFVAPFASNTAEALRDQAASRLCGGQGDSDDKGADFDASAAARSEGRRGFLGRAGIGAGATFAISGSGIFNPGIGIARADVLPVAAVPSENPDTRASRVVLWGFGNQNKLMARYLWEKKIPVVGVVSRHDIGKDYGLIDFDPWPSIKKKTGVKIVGEKDAAAMMASAKPNVCLLCTRSTLEDVMPSLITCANSQVNVITIAEELLFSGGTSPQMTNELDAIFKKNGVSVTGSGFIDGACCEMAMALSGMMHKITGLDGILQYNVDDYGPVLADAHGVGLTLKEFQTNIVDNDNQEKSYVYNSNEWFASALGLTLSKTVEERQPVTELTPIYSKAKGRTIPAGDVIGMRVVATTTTKQGVIIKAEQIGKCYKDSNEKDHTEWEFLGEPKGVKFSIDAPPISQMTNTATISRIPQILSAPPGYITSDHFDITVYQHWS